MVGSLPGRLTTPLDGICPGQAAADRYPSFLDHVSHIRWRTCVADQLSNHKGRYPRLGWLRRCRLLCDPSEVVRIAIGDRPAGDAGHLVGVIFLGSGDDLAHSATAGVQGHTSLGALVDFAAPSVDRAHWGEVVGAGTQAIFGELAGGDVGGIQNTVTNLGASIGTALAGAVLISALTTSFLTGIQHNPAVPKDVASKAQVELAGGIPFLSDQDLKTQLDKADVPPKTADAIVTENANARIDGLRSSLALLAVVALLALFATRRIPAQQPTASPESEPAA